MLYVGIMLIIANWKMNGSLAESKAYFESLDVGGGATVVICPPFPLLQYDGEVARSVSTVQVGAQNCHWE